MSKYGLEINDEEFGKELVNPIVNNTLAFASANQILVSSMVKHLIDKGLINREEYLKNNKEDEINILENLKKIVDDEAELEARERALHHVFSMHRNDLNKPE